MEGYLSIFLVGLDVGNLILPVKPRSLPYFQSPRISTFMWLILFSLISTAAFQLSTEYFRLLVSRRLVPRSFGFSDIRQISHTCFGPLPIIQDSCWATWSFNQFSSLIRVRLMMMRFRGRWKHSIVMVLQCSCWYILLILICCRR